MFQGGKTPKKTQKPSEFQDFCYFSRFSWAEKLLRPCFIRFHKKSDFSFILHLNGPNLAPSPRISRNVSPIPFQVLHRHSNSMPSATNLKIRSESFRLINERLMNNQFESSNNLLGNDDVKFTIGVEEKKSTRSLTKNLTVK